MTDRETNTLAARGLEELFSSCAVVVSVFCFWREIGFSVTYVLRVQYSCGVVFVFWFWREIVFGVTYYMYLEYIQYSCAVVSVFWLWWEIILKMRTPFHFVWAVSTKKSYWVTLLWSASQSIFCYCVSLSCIVWIYNLTVMIISQKYGELSVQVEISE